MPKAEIPNSSAQVVTSGIYGPTTWVNVWYYEILTPAAGDPGDTMIDLLSAAADFYNKVGFAHFSNTWEHQTSKVLYRDAGGSFNRSATIADAVGTDDSGDQDAQVAYLFNWFTGDVRRGGKARQYVSGVPMDACADSARITSGFQGSIQSGLDDWLLELAAGTLPNSSVLALVEMSFVDGKADRTTPAMYPVTGGRLNPVVATQRRRIDRLRS